MSLEQRLRTGLSANIEHLQPDLDRGLSVLLRRVHRRRRARAAGVGLTAACAAAASAMFLPGVVDDIGAGGDHGPVTRPVQTDTAPTPRPRWDRPLNPGRYTVVVEGSPAPRPVIKLPAGFSFEVSFGVFEKDPGADGRRGVGFWNGEQLKVDANLCDGGFRAGLQDPGPTVEDIANVLADQPGMRTTDPVPVSLGGYDGLYVELERPADATQCDGDVLWLTDKDGPYHDYLDLGVVDRFWILDVSGHRLVIEAHHTVEASSDDDVTELTDIVESTTFPNAEPSQE